ncbi:MAG: peptidase S8 [Kofleriaceae bacterium]|nr:peptidase S8 [Kofleriaceae bacterium]
MGTSSGNKSRSKIFWIFLLIAMIMVWVYFQPAEDNGVSQSEMEADRVAAIASDSSGVDRDDILVDLDDDVSASDIAAIEAEFDIDLVLVSDQSEDEQFYRAHVRPELQASILAALQKHDDVEIAERDALYTIDPNAVYALPDLEAEHKGYPNDPKYKYQWHMDQINMPEAWKLASGEGVIVAVLDTGVAYEDYEKFHMVEDLEGVAITKPYDFVGNTTHANDDHGHGTHVAGTIAQATHNGKGVTGVGREITIMPLKVLSGSGSGSVAGIADAIRYAADEGAHVINMSLGGPFPSRVLKKAVAYAHDKGVTVICAAGNDGKKKLGYPAGYPGAVAVAATQYDKSTTFYSNYGKNLDIAAPGGNMRVDQSGDGEPDGVMQNTIVIGDPTKSGYFGFMGTSMAAPHAAGVAALIVGEGISDPKAVEQILKDTASHPEGYTSERYGAGLIDAEAAILKARSETGAWQFLLGALLAGAVLFGTRKRINVGAGFAGGVLAGSGGLFFLPYISSCLASLPGVNTLTHGLPAWDMALLGGIGHGNVLFYSALVPLGLIALLGGIPKARAILAGLGLGVAGHFLFHVLTGVSDIRFMGADSLWLVANAAVLTVVSAVMLKRRAAE